MNNYVTNLTSLSISLILIASIQQLHAPHEENGGYAEIRDPEPKPYLPFVAFDVNSEYRLPLDVGHNYMLDIIFKYPENNANLKPIFFCPQKHESTNLLMSLTTDLDYCLFKVDDSESQRCETEVQPLILPLNEECGPLNDPGILYGFGYKICEKASPTTNTNHDANTLGHHIKKLFSIVKTDKKDSQEFINQQFLTIYEFCYNSNLRSVTYTWHRIWSPLLLRDPNKLGRFRMYTSYTKDTNDYQLFGMIFQQMAEMFLEDRSLTPHFMVPLTHMALGLCKKTLYHYANVKSMQANISTLWIFIDENLKKKAIESDMDLQIFMTTFTISSEEHVETIWYKIVHDMKSNAATVIMVHETKPKLPHCSTHFNCDFNNWEEQEFKYLAYCCEVEKYHLEHLGKMDLAFGHRLQFFTDSLTQTETK